jgi:hypothetical protein
MIYGAGDLGKIVCCWLQSLNINVDALIDDNLEKTGTVCCGVPVISLAAVGGRDADCLILVANNYFSTVLPRLRSMGIRLVSDCSALFDETPFDGAVAGVHPLEVNRKIQWHRREAAKWRTGSDLLALKYIDIVVTEACSMKCADCSNLMQYYQKPKNADTGQLLSAIDKLFAAVDWIDEIRLLGGEPFVNKQFNEILGHVRQYDRYSHIVIYTNGTILPGPALLEQLEDTRITVNITNYGSLSRRLEPLVDELAARGVSHIIKNPEWTDSGRLNPQNRSAAQLDAMFARCCVNDVLTLLHGTVYRCPFSANATNLGAVVQRDDEVVHLAEGIDEVRNKLRALYGRTNHVAACAVCNGRDYSVPKIVPAKQTRVPLPLPVWREALSKDP